METKKCSKCEITKDIKEFNNNNNNKCWCKKCQSLYAKKYYKDNKEIRLEKNKKYYRKNKDKYIKRANAWREKNPKKATESLKKSTKKWYKKKGKEYARNKREKDKEKLKIYRKKYRKDNLEKIKECTRKYYKKNKEEIAKKRREWRINNPEKRREENRKRRNNKYKAKGYHTEQEWQQKKREYNYCCAYCGIKEKDLIKKYKCKKWWNLTEDHIIPITKNGTDYINNIVPACIGCNSSKKNKIKWQT